MNLQAKYLLIPVLIVVIGVAVARKKTVVEPSRPQAQPSNIEVASSGGARAEIKTPLTLADLNQALVPGRTTQLEAKNVLGQPHAVSRPRAQTGNERAKIMSRFGKGHVPAFLRASEIWGYEFKDPYLKVSIYFDENQRIIDFRAYDKPMTREELASQYRGH